MFGILLESDVVVTIEVDLLQHGITRGQSTDVTFYRPIITSRTYKDFKQHVYGGFVAGVIHYAVSWYSTRT